MKKLIFLFGLVCMGCFLSCGNNEAPEQEEPELQAEIQMLDSLSNDLETTTNEIETKAKELENALNALDIE